MFFTTRIAPFAFVSTFIIGCGHSEVAAPRAPVPELPHDVEQRTAPPEPGTTRVTIDANGERATVVDVVERKHATAYADGVTAHGEAETTKPVCVAPCVVDLKPGMHVLRFASDTDPNRVSEANIQIGDREKVVRHAIGRSESASWGWRSSYVLTWLGFSTAVAGAILYGVASSSSAKDAGGMQDFGMWTLVGGGSAMLIGIPLMFLTRPVHQPGATTEIAAR